MKKTILTTVLIMTVLFIFSTVSYAQSNNNIGWQGAIANLAQQENLPQDQNETAKQTENDEAEIKVANADLRDSVGTNQAENTEVIEN